MDEVRIPSYTYSASSEVETEAAHALLIRASARDAGSRAGNFAAFGRAYGREQLCEIYFSIIFTITHIDSCDIDEYRDINCDHKLKWLLDTAAIMSG